MLNTIYCIVRFDKLHPMVYNREDKEKGAAESLPTTPLTPTTQNIVVALHYLFSICAPDYRYFSTH